MDLLDFKNKFGAIVLASMRYTSNFPLLFSKFEPDSFIDLIRRYHPQKLLKLAR